MLLGFEFNSELLGPSLVLGLAQAGLYGLLAVALVLTFRVSRTVAMVHGGFAMLGSIGVWWLTYESPNFKGSQPNLNGLLGIAVIIATGAILGALYGALVTSRRMAAWPKVTLTTFSLGIMLLFIGVIPLLFPANDGGFDRPPSPFPGGDDRHDIFGAFISTHQIIVLCTIVAVGGALSWVIARTRGGIYLRAVADDVEASRWVGVPLWRVGIAVYATAGALSTLAGAMIAPVLSPDFIEVVFVFIRAATAAVIGGFSSFPLAIAGCVFFALSDTMLRTGVIGESTPGQREMVTMAVIFLAVFLIAKYRRNLIELVDAEGM